MHCDAQEGSMCTSGRPVSTCKSDAQCGVLLIHEIAIAIAAALQGFSHTQPHAIGRHQALHYTESCTGSASLVDRWHILSDIIAQ